MRSHYTVGVRGSLILGLVIVAIGALLTLDNLGLVNAGAVLRWWHLLLIAYGLARLTGFGCRRNYTAGGLFLLGGLWFMLHDLGLLHWSIWDFWPVVLIVLGGSMVARSLSRDTPSADGEDRSSHLNAFAIMSGTVRKVVAQDFRTGEVFAFMGGHEIDLRSAKMAQDTAVIDLLVLMGGIDLRVPEDWKVTMDGMVIMGGLEDHSKAPVEPHGHLILKGLVMMGGVEIKN